MLTALSLFSGLGSSDLAAEWAGFKTLAMCEIDPWCQKVLKHHWPDMPIIGDIRDVTKERIERIIADSYYTRQQQSQRGKQEERRWTDDGSKITSNSKCKSGRQETESRIDILLAGVPCQPASIAGKRKGASDDRWLWPEAFRVLSELKPTWAVFENPLGISNLVESGEEVNLEEGAFVEISELNNSAVLDGLISQIEEIGYEVQTICIPATSVGAWHLRYRLFIIAHARQLLCDGYQGQGIHGENEARSEVDTGGESEITFHAKRAGLERTVAEGRECSERLSAKLPLGDSEDERRKRGGFAWERRNGFKDASFPDWAGGEIPMPRPLTESKRPDRRSFIEQVRYMVPGSADRLVRYRISSGERIKRLKALGNCNPPQQYYPIYKAIADIERSL